MILKLSNPTVQNSPYLPHNPFLVWRLPFLICLHNKRSPIKSDQVVQGFARVGTVISYLKGVTGCGDKVEVPD